MKAGAALTRRKLFKTSGAGLGFLAAAGLAKDARAQTTNGLSSIASNCIVTTNCGGTASIYYFVGRER